MFRKLSQWLTRKHPQTRNVATTGSRLGLESLEDRHTPSTWTVNVPPINADSLTYTYVELVETSWGLLFVTVNNQIVAAHYDWGVTRVELRGSAMQEETFVVRQGGLPLTLRGNGPDNMIMVGSDTSDRIEVGSSSVGFIETATGDIRGVIYSGLNTVQVNAGDGNDTVRVNSETSTARVVALGEGGKDILAVTSSGPNQPGPLHDQPGAYLEGGEGDDIYIVGGQYDPSGPDRALNASYSLDRLRGTVEVSEEGTGGNDSLYVLDLASQDDHVYSITGTRGLTRGSVQIDYDIGIERIDLHAGQGDDTVTVATNRKVAVYGHGGNDTLIGGPAADILVGGDGRDTLQGNGGYDVLVGGSESDSLSGGEGEDLLIGSDLNVVPDGMNNIRNIWSLETVDFNVRKDYLSYAINLYLVPDRAPDHTDGGPDHDWVIQ